MTDNMIQAPDEREAIVRYLEKYQDDLDHRGDSILTGIYNAISEVIRHIEDGYHLSEQGEG